MIRLATTDDAAALAQIHVQSWLETYMSLVPDEVLAAIIVADRER
jgi:hypothetical protein